MATLQINSQLQVIPSSTGGFTFVIPQVSFSAITLSGTGFKAGLQSVGFAAAEDLDYGDVVAANAGWLVMRNTDSTNYVQWGLNHSGTIRVVGRMKPLEPWVVFRVEPSAQIMLQANTAACQVEYYLIQT